MVKDKAVALLQKCVEVLRPATEFAAYHLADISEASTISLSGSNSWTFVVKVNVVAVLGSNTLQCTLIAPTDIPQNSVADLKPHFPQCNYPCQNFWKWCGSRKRQWHLRGAQVNVDVQYTITHVTWPRMVLSRFSSDVHSRLQRHRVLCPMPRGRVCRGRTWYVLDSSQVAWLEHSAETNAATLRDT